jgi:histidyl-tRNA synthetase
VHRKTVTELCRIAKQNESKDKRISARDVIVTRLDNEKTSAEDLLVLACYDYLGKQLGSRKPNPAVGGAIGVDRIIEGGFAEHLSPRILKKPKVFFIQFGFEAKLKSLPIIEAMRKAKIPLRQSLSKDSLSAQLSQAERMGVPWVVILGQREVIENTVIVRNMENRSQDVVAVAELSDYIKKKIVAK